MLDREEYRRLRDELHEARRELDALAPRARVVEPTGLEPRVLTAEESERWEQAAERYRRADEALLAFLRGDIRA